MTDYCQCGPGHPANGAWCYICERPAKDDGGYAEFAAALEDGEPFVFCLTCRHIALEGHNCLAWPSADEEVTADADR